MQNEPNLVRLRRIQNPLSRKGLRKNRPSGRTQKRTQTNPKRTQFLPRQGPSKPKRTQTNPKQTQFPKNPKINPTFFYTRPYETNAKFSPTRTNPNKPKANPIKANFLMPNKTNATPLPTKAYENETTFGRNQNKPNQTQFGKQKNAAAFDD